MENVGIYTPPKKTRPVVSSGSDVFIASLTQNELEVTQSAQDKLHEIISQTDEDVSAIRIYISDGFKILVDVVALNYLKGAQIDYIQEVGRERFVFNNVFAETGGSGVCGGCGAAGGG
jgi:iron-sulfur cluster insertion protein